MKNIIFIGMPAVGKSTIGVVAAKHLGYNFIDTDLLIQEKEKRLLKDIIAQEGLEEFLKIEDRINAGVSADITICEDGIGLEDTFELVLNTLKDRRIVTD